MHIPAVAKIVPVLILLAVTQAEWEVFNGLSDAGGDDFDLAQEQLIPVEGAGTKGSQSNLRNLASVDRSKNQNMGPKTDLKNADLQKQNINPPASSKSTSNKEVKLSNAKNTTPLTSTTRRKTAVSKLATTPKTLDLDILDDNDIKEEGFYLVDDDKKKRTSRKLTQFVELFSQDTQESIKNLKEFDELTSLSEGAPVREQHLEDRSEHPLEESAAKMQPLAEGLTEAKIGDNSVDDSSHQELGKTIAVEFDPSLKLACVDDTSWECLMFREDFNAMKNFSGRISGRERVRRQASAVNQPTRASQNMNQVIDCEHGDCFSGNGSDTSEEVVEPQFSFGKTTQIHTNDTALDGPRREAIANETIQQLTEIFKNVPGFKNITLDPSKITITTDGQILIPWDVNIDGGDPIFSAMNGTEVRNAIGQALVDAEKPYKNFTIDNQHPKDDFNSTDAADQIQQQAKDPCKMDPDPCPFGFGSCTRLPDQNRGIQLKCIDNCYTYPSCGSNGACQKDISGKAYCLCANQWAGMYCDRPNDTSTPTNQNTTPKFDFTSQSKFNTSLMPSDLTPEKKADIARNMTSQLAELQKNLPGFQNVTVNPDSITIDKNGQLVVDWVTSLDPTAYNGKNPEQIGDSVREGLLNVTQTYRETVVIDGQKPVEDFDAVSAGNQIVEAAANPCKNIPCQTGYGSCIAVNATSVTCVHNCNSIPVCQHSGTCQIDHDGSAICQCPSGWSGNSCEESIQTLDGGEITGIVLGGALVTAGLIGCIWCFLLARKGDNVNFTTYEDVEGVNSFSDPSSRLFVVDRPAINADPNPLYSASPYVTPDGSLQPSNSDNAS